MRHGTISGKRVYVRRRGPRPAVWLTLCTMAVLTAFIFYARPVIRTLSVDLNEAPVMDQAYITQEITFDAVSAHLITLARMDDPAQARVEASRYVSRGAAGYVLYDHEKYLVLGNSYMSREDAESVCASLLTEESIQAEILTRSAEPVLLRVTAASEQLNALTEGDRLLRRLDQELWDYALWIDRSERPAPVVRAALSFCGEEASRASQRLTRAAGNSPNPVATGVIDLLNQAEKALTALAQDTQDTLMSFSSGIKHTRISLLMGHIDFLNELSASASQTLSVSRSPDTASAESVS